ncbi:hydroxyacylglutathione hydrolase [Sodalis ligni]|jgi:hydroxyacylglutathione hydrolase|uniref:Hydroxyacylglutathione hydrolase n=1 Tax=Sodalis ligni TaxID=2697027 RepID=A0A4R1NHX0_9GAMM|nr:hydroxyacylglutathione hydrolase [Sodalis ligni]TCL06667.1 hydroxyacylglutathione hydrolase [Sodalis ligni]
MNLISIPAFQDNYIWLLYNNQQESIIVDPGEAAPAVAALTERRLTLKGILLTHHHQDHVGGVADLVARYHVPVYGPQETASKGADHIVGEGDRVNLLDLDFQILAFPGHTLGHIGFYSAPYLFCGDTVFSAGCGRLFEGTPRQMYESFQKVKRLPPDTLICAAHEYTLANLAFARSILPEDEPIAAYEREIRQLRSKNQASLPSTLQIEDKINLFLRCHDIDLQRKLDPHHTLDEEWRIFALLREKKDHF